MYSIKKLLSISSEPQAPNQNAFPEFLRAYALGRELFGMLELKNGFYTFESSLHIFPITSDPKNGLEGWNSMSLWRSGYQDLADGLLFFAEDVFQDRFCLSSKVVTVLRFHAETGQTDFVADSIEKWAHVVLTNFQTEAGWKLAHEWQQRYGPLPRGKRLMAKLPFFLGGEYKVENLWVGNPLEGMNFKADLALQTRDLPDGAKIKLNIGPKSE